MKEVILNLILGSIALAISFLFKKTEGGPSWIDISLGLFIAMLVRFGLVVWEGWDRIKLILQSVLWKSKQPIRVSMAYLFRIKVDGKYFLIKNHRDQPGYQPVGGVYRYLENENADFFDRIGLIPDHHMPVDKQSRNDLRKQLKERRFLNEFLQWFNSKKNRETDPWREFYEELIVDGIIDGLQFPYIQYTLCKSSFTGIQRSTKFPVDEFMYADIYELKWENASQKQAFEALFKMHDDRYVFATSEEIQKGFTSDGKVIITHSKKIL